MVRYSYDHTLSKKASLLLKRSRKVKAWYNEVSGLLQIRTATDYVDDLARVVEDVKKTPEQLLKMRPKTIYNLLKGWVISKTRSDMLSHKRSHAMWYAVSSFLKFHEQHIGGDFPLRRLVVKNLDKIPTKQDLKLIMNAASSLSTKISILLMAYSGLRPEDVCDLTYASIKHDFERGGLSLRSSRDAGKDGRTLHYFLT
jgi:integrase